jgi:hypothetical protein
VVTDSTVGGDTAAAARPGKGARVVDAARELAYRQGVARTPDTAARKG